MPPTVALIFMLSLLTFRLLTTVIHELGHAIPALLLTDEKVTIYLGSHGNPENSAQFQIGRLECFFKFNLFYWRGGLCVMHEKEIPLRTNFIVTIFGPLLSLLIAGITSLLLLLGDFTDITTLVLFALIFSCTLDFIHNIVPNQSAIELYDGKIVHNDGTQLLQLFHQRTIQKEYEKGVLYFEQQEYTKAAQKFEELLNFENEHEVFYRLAIHSNLMIRNFENAKKLQEVFSKKYKDSFDTNDFINSGVIYSYFDKHEKSITCYNKALEIDAKQIMALNNRAYAYSLIDEHEKAIVDLDTAISIDPKFAFAWNNRGFSKLELGQLEAGLQDIQQSLQLDDQNSYAYRNLGLYHFYTKNYSEAFSLYQKAKELDASTKFLEEYITAVEKFV